MYKQADEVQLLPVSLLLVALKVISFVMLAIVLGIVPTSAFWPCTKSALLISCVVRHVGRLQKHKQYSYTPREGPAL